MADLSGKTILVTGASGGIGGAIARALGQAGAHVVLHYHSDRAGAEGISSDITASRKLLLQADFSDSREVDKLWDAALAWHDRLDVLINAAGVMLWHGGIGAELNAWDEVWDQSLRVNVLAPARLMRAAVRHYQATGGGAIITVSSWVTQRGVGNPDSLAYGATKAALHSMTQSIARGYARDNILAYIVAPGIVDAPMSHAFASTQPGGRVAVESKLAMGEWVPPTEVAELVTFLATGKVRHLTGATLDVNGASNIR